MKRHRNRHQNAHGYFALSTALLVSVLTTVIVLSLHSKFARLDAESVLLADREDYAIARQLENMIHDSVQRVVGQRFHILSSPSNMETEISLRLPSLSLPPNCTVEPYNSGNLHPEPPPLAFFPESLQGSSREPRSGEVTAADTRFGSLGGLLRFGYYTPNGTDNKHTRSFVRLQQGEPETYFNVESYYYSVPITSQRLVICNYPPDLAGTRPLSAPNLNALEPSDRFSALITTRFVADGQSGEVIDPVNAPGPTESLKCYRHRSQLCEELYQYIFKGNYLPTLASCSRSINIDVSDLTTALKTHDGLYTQEQENTPPGEPLPPPTNNRIKLDINRFDSSELIYLSSPSATPLEITLLDSSNNSRRLGSPLMIVFDGRSGPGRFVIRFQEFINRPILYVLTSTTVEFSASTTGASGVPSGAIAGAFLMDEASSFSEDGSCPSPSRIVFGAIIGHHSLLTNGFRGANEHPTPVREFPNQAFYQEIEAFSPRAYLVKTKSTLQRVKTKDAVVLTQ